MPYLVNSSIEVDGTDLTPYAASVGVFQDSDDVNVDTMGVTVHKHLSGLGNDRFEATFLADPEGVVRGTLNPLKSTAGTNVEFTVIVTDNGDGTVYTSTACIMLGFNPIAGDPGARAEVPVVFPSNTEIIATGGS
jgi:hypothetical protein